MSRFKQWRSALVGLSKSIEQSGIKTNKSNFKEEKKVIDDFCRKEKIGGSFSEKVLKVSDNYNSFKDFINEKSDNT